jgi:hypothetical protein
MLHNIIIIIICYYPNKALHHIIEKVLIYNNFCRYVCVKTISMYACYIGVAAYNNNTDYIYDTK